MACQNKWRRIEALGRQRSFVESYFEAFTLYRGGNRDVVFPEGTYALRYRVGVRCGPPV